MHGVTSTSCLSLMRADEAKAMKKSITTYAQTAKSLLVMDESLEENMGKKFDIIIIMLPPCQGRHGMAWLFENIQQSTRWRCAMG